MANTFFDICQSLALSDMHRTVNIRFLKLQRESSIPNIENSPSRYIYIVLYINIIFIYYMKNTLDSILLMCITISVIIIQNLFFSSSMNFNGNT